ARRPHCPPACLRPVARRRIRRACARRDARFTQHRGQWRRCRTARLDAGIRRDPAGGRACGHGRHSGVRSRSYKSDCPEHGLDYPGKGTM
ncbi:MAG: hypothetical protein AVDCRST_MAG71-581, partial [uncultured Lysobacter sp.]